MEPDVRWRQRAQNFRLALQRLEQACDREKWSDLEQQGVIKAFEYTYELAWNTLRDYLRHQGPVELHGSRDTFRKAFQEGLITEGQEWLLMLQDQNLTVHTYDDETAQRVLQNIRQRYLRMFQQLQAKLQQLDS